MKIEKRDQNNLVREISAKKSEIFGLEEKIRLLNLVF